MQYFFFVHAGAKIGTLRGNEFTPSLHLYWYLEETSHIPSLRLPLIAEENYDAGWYRVFHGK